MLKRKVLAGAAEGRVSGADVSGAEEERGYSLSRQMALVIVLAALGLIMPRARVYGALAPFGVAFAAAVPGPGALAVYLASFVGYVLPGGPESPLRYIAALAAVAGIRWSLAGMKTAARHPAFAPVAAFLSMECTGLALGAVTRLSAAGVLLTTAESLLAGGTAYFLSTAVRLLRGEETPGMLTAQQQAGIVMAGAIVLTAGATIQFNGIAPGRILAGMAVLLMARCCKEQGGSVAGIVLGLAMGLASPEHWYLAVAFAFGGLVAGVFARYGRFAAAGAYLAANLIVTMSAGTAAEAVAGIYEALASSLLFVVLPARADRLVNRFFLRAKDVPAVEGLRRSVVLRLDYASRAMAEVASTVDAVSQKLAGLSAPDLGSVYRAVSEDVCRICGLRMHCWERHFNDTMAILNDLTPVLRERGRITRNDLPGELHRLCGRMDEVVARINAGYLEYAVREGAWRRLSEIRAVVTDQFSGMSELLSELSQDFSRTEQVDAEAGERVAAVCEEFGLSVRDAVCLLGRGGRMTVEILASDAGVRLDREKWRESVGAACGRELDHPVVTRLADSVKIAMTEKPLLAVKYGYAQLHCTGERLCGDAVETFSDGAGRWYAVLSDGMGSGGRAAVDGAMASGLASRLIQAGFGPESVLRMVNSALMVKSGDESLATLDVLELDLFTGKIDCRKAGASPTLLCSRGRVSRLEPSSLPLGILRDIRAERTEDTLTDGDILLMFSDGAMTGGLEWVEDRLRKFDPREGGMKALAEEIAREARGRQERREDDVTVLAVEVRRVG